MKGKRPDSAMLTGWAVWDAEQGRLLTHEIYQTRREGRYWSQKGDSVIRVAVVRLERLAAMEAELAELREQVARGR